MDSRNSKKLGVKAEVNWLNFSRTGTSAGSHINLHRFRHGSKAAPLEHPAASPAAVPTAVGNYCSGGHTHTYALTAPCEDFPGSIQHVRLGTGQPPARPLSHPPGSEGQRSAALLPLLPPDGVGVAALCGDTHERDRAKGSCRSSVTSAHSGEKPTGTRALQTQELRAYTFLNGLGQLRARVWEIRSLSFQKEVGPHVIYCL